MTNHKDQTNTSDLFQNIQIDRLAWMWLLIGFVLLPFTIIQPMIPLWQHSSRLYFRWLRFARASAHAQSAIP